MKTKIGGQAVLEGVMMRGATSMALSVRDETGQIRVETTRLPTKKPWYRKVPFLRGVVNLFISLIDGFRIIGKSAEISAEYVSTDDDNKMSAVMATSIIIGVYVAIAFFILLPTYLTKGIVALSPNLDWDGQFAWLNSLIEGLCKLAVLVGYMGGISHMKEIKRVFMYHGAEHKTIACYEAELPLTVENVKKCSRYHDRCGTSFIVFVVVLSVILTMILDIVCVSLGFTAFIEKRWLRSLLKIALLPITAGFSYEMLMLLARTNFILFRPLKWLGKQFQKLTTREPDESMCEVAICSFNKVLEMDSDQTIPEIHFPEPISLEEFRRLAEESGIAEFVGNVDDWVISAILVIDEKDLKKELKIPFGWAARLQKIVEKCKNGEPWQYAVGDAPFFGRTFAVNGSVFYPIKETKTLIPRQETELVAEKATAAVKNGSKVLDLCCGCGAIGITVAAESAKKNVKVSVTCSDIDKDALEIAKVNAKINNTKVKFVESDMFGKISGKFDVIVCNPPYIESATIGMLDKSVKDFEPHSALDGGEDGLKFYRVLAEHAPEHLRNDGILILEIGYNQGKTVSTIMEKSFAKVEVFKDYSKNDRIVVCSAKRHNSRND